jgi:hypothetical protein
MKKLGYFGEAESKLVRFAGEEVVPQQGRMKSLFLRAYSEQGFDSLYMR